MIFCDNPIYHIYNVGTYECNTELYRYAGLQGINPSTESGGRKLGEIDIGQNMMYSMEITVNSIPTGWASIFHCGSANTIRQPGIWLHPESDDQGATYTGFHISYSTTTNYNPWVNPTPHVQIGQKYELKIVIQDGYLRIYLDGVEVHAEGGNIHNILEDEPCFAGDPWYEGADVLIENIVIESIVHQTTPCDECCSSLSKLPKWRTRCPKMGTKRRCEKLAQCNWHCASCEWDGSYGLNSGRLTPARLAKRCEKKANEEECDEECGCEWGGWFEDQENVLPVLNQQINHKMASIALEPESYSLSMIFALAAFIVLIAIGAFIYYGKKDSKYTSLV